MRHKGRAINFLKFFVDELQQEGSPYAAIRLNAYSRFNQFNGKYIWSKLGFEIYENTTLRKPKMTVLYEDFKTFIKDLDYYYANFKPKDTSNKNELEVDLDKLKKEAEEQVRNQHTPWDSANFTVLNFPIGEIFMRHYPSAYKGELYPNAPNSLGMIQYNKRVSQF